MASRKSGRGKARAGGTPEPVFDRHLMEQHLAGIGRLLAGKEFASVEEANAYLQEALVGGELVAPEPATPLERAQEVIYEAMESRGKRRVQLAREALAISPDCADAYVLLAEQASDPEKARHLYQQGVEAGERALGPGAFTEAMGHFWGVLETRPYMRARLGLAQALWFVGERKEAIGHLQAMLELNPGDNQGIRYLLAGWLLATGDDNAVEQVLDRYPDEWSASWAYTRALLAFRRKGPGKEADAALKEALGANPHVPLYLLGLDPMPKHLPEYYSPGDQNEAITYLLEGIEGWMETPGALNWVGETLVRLGAASVKPKRGQR